MNKLAFALTALLLISCGGADKFGGDAGGDTSTDTPGADTSTDGPWDTGLDTPPDTSPDVPPDVTDTTPDPSCTPGEIRCSTDGSSLEQCRSDGLGWDSTPCPFACSPSPEPHCREWVISNIPDSDLLSAGATPTGDPWPGGIDYWIEFDTDTGAAQIHRYSDGELVRVLRPPDTTGLHADSGIHFTTVAQPGEAPDLGIFSFQSLQIPSNYILFPSGDRALVLLSEEDATIDGGVYNGCTVFYGGSVSSNEGTGAGTPGSTGPWVGDGYRDGGGGGGAFGGHGGDGGGYTPDLRGLGGSPYGVPELIPLLAGSGGGDGGGTGGGRWGGPSGGATQIVSGGSLTINGWVDTGGCGGYSAYYAAEGGGGGGSGGGILLEAPRLIISGAVTSNGGGGGAGGGGSDPDWPLYGEDGQIASTTAAAGGLSNYLYSCDGGAGNGGGGDDGSHAPTCDAAPEDYNGGGGGGSGGRIRLNGMYRDLSSSTLSPSMTSPATTEAELTLI